jgi:putative Holliday junction resolvase
VSRILALDIGDKRIGVALSDTTQTLASPFTIIERTDDDSTTQEILKMVADREVSCVIVGLPRSLDGSIGYQAQKVQSFTQELKERLNIPIEYRDERFTTVAAVQKKKEASTKKLKRKTRFDAMAAAIILQEYLDEKASTKPK